MTDLRTRLADAVMDGVGADEHDAYQVVDVLLSLPGVAVVDIERSAQAIWQTYAVETGRSLPAGLADKLALAAVNAAEHGPTK